MSGVQPTTGPPPATSGGSGGQQQSTAQSHDDTQKQPQTPPPPQRPAVSLSASLAPLAEGMRFEAAIAGRDADGLPLLRSANASFVIVGESEPLPPNTRLLLQVLTLGNTVRAAILSANGQALHPPPQISLELTRAAPLAAGPLPNPPAGQPQPVPGLTAPPAPLDAGAQAAPRLTVGAPLVATLVANAGAGAAQAAAGPEGTTFLLRVLTIGRETAPGQAKTQAAASAKTSNAVPAATGQSGAAAKAGTATPAAASASATSASSAAQPAARPAATIPGYDAATATAAAGNRLDGMIVGKNAAGQVLFRSPAGLLALQTNTNLRAGTRLSVEVVSRTTPAEQLLPAQCPVIAPTTFEPLADILTQVRNWPELREMLEILRALEPALASQLVAQTMPMPNKRLTTTLLFFFTALQAGNLRQWLGDNVIQALQRAGRRDLLMKLDDDFKQVSRLAGETGGGDWRTLIMPLYDGHELHQLMLFYRHHGGHGDDGENQEESTRFVLNLILSSLGPMQLDGLVQDRRFNLFVRSKQPLDKVVQSDLTTIFGDGLEATGWKGTLAFQVGGQFPVSPLEEVIREAHGDGLVV